MDLCHKLYYHGASPPSGVLAGAPLEARSRGIPGKQSRAREYLAAIVAEFEASAQDPFLHRRMTTEWLARGSDLGGQLDRFVGGEQLSALILLKLSLLELYFQPAVERRQEADHSIVSKAVNSAGLHRRRH